MQRFVMWLIASCAICSIGAPLRAQHLAGISVTPHTQSAAMRWREPPDPQLGARVELFLHNDSASALTLDRSVELTFDGRTPESLVEGGEWAWHDTPAVWSELPVELAPDRLAVFQFNGKGDAWGIGSEHALRIGNRPLLGFALSPPNRWISSVTFRAIADDGSKAESPFPNQLIVHLRNAADEPLEVQSLTIWLPEDPGNRRVFRRAHRFDSLACFPTGGVLSGAGRAGFVVQCQPLPLTYAVLEVTVRVNGQTQGLWSIVRVKHDQFDISGGWIASDIHGRNSLSIEEYLQTLRRMYINTGQIESVPGYTDQPDLYARFPIKLFNRLQDLQQYDGDAWLPKIHAVEFLGEPQFGGGRPMPPQEVHDLLAPYGSSRLPTTVTLSDERTWRYYAGLSDFPHYDAYRVIAPAADQWSAYDRWGGQRIRWGAPLETIGDMTRSLRELSRPRPIAYWSQGAHDGWGSVWSPRRGSPTAEELRSQAWHGLANRIHSLYWFNLSLASLVKFPDLIEPITRIGREVRLLEELLLTGDAFEHTRIEIDGQPLWDLDSIAGPQSALLVVHDLQYEPDPRERVFRFQKRPAEVSFAVPEWLGDDPKLLRVDAGGIHDVPFRNHDGRIEFADEIEVVGIYVLTIDRTLNARLVERHKRLLEQEDSIGFDPANREEDLARLKSILAAP